MFRGVCNGITIELPFPSEAEGEKIGLAHHAGIATGFEQGLWEQCEVDRVNRLLPPDMDLIEFGAGTGYLSCLTNKKLTEGVRHVVFEANPILIPVVEHNRDLNGCNFEVVGKAYGVGQPSIDYLVTTPWDNIVALPRPVTFKVDTTSLGEVVKEYDLESYSLIIDVEGSEFDIVKEPREALEKCKFMLIEIHTPGAEAGHRGFDNSADIKGFLASLGFVLKDKCGCPNCIYVYERKV